MFTVDVTEDFLDYLEYGTLAVEVYGYRHTVGFSNEYSVTAEDDGQYKSFPDRYVLHINACGVGVLHWMLARPSVPQVL